MQPYFILIFMHTPVHKMLTMTLMAYLHTLIILKVNFCLLLNCAATLMAL